SRWEITNNWQLLYPVAGILGLGYSAYKLASLFNIEQRLWQIVLALAIFITALKVTLLLFKWLETRWKVDQRWKVIRIFIVFAITGSLSLVVTKPVFELIGLVRSNFEMNGLTLVLYQVLRFLAILPFYTLLLVFFGWMFREYKFFLNFALKMVSRFGLKNIVKQIDQES
ncbi:MAG: hypothetical protein KJO25_03945, partial [Bacteroidia bacterium]|nr:hypothetical protein [Bacteroidia bacterium]